MYDPFGARRHGARMLRESQLLEILEVLMPVNGANGPVYALYGDLAYPQCAHIMLGFRNAAVGSPQRLFNTHMSKARVAVEWGFRNIIAQRPYLDFTELMKTFKLPVARYYTNAAFLCNLRNCYYGNQTFDHFKCERLSVRDYLA
jgi:hypothetical protein